MLFTLYYAHPIFLKEARIDIRFDGIYLLGISPVEGNVFLVIVVGMDLDASASRIGGTKQGCQQHQAQSA